MDLTNPTVLRWQYARNESRHDSNQGGRVVYSATTHSHWNLGVSEFQQLAALIANMVEDQLRTSLPHHPTAESEEETRDD